jgi:hypothetical protein
MIDIEPIFVPMSVDALVVSEAAGAPATWADLSTDNAFADASKPRKPGVYLRWALPSALAHQTTNDPSALQASLTQSPRIIPDRWAIYRIWFPKGATQGSWRGWVVDSLAAVPTSPAPIPGGWDGHAPTDGRRITAFGLGTEQSDGSFVLDTGAHPGFAAYYDRCAGRLTFYDQPTTADLAGATTATYVVAGWYGDNAYELLGGGDETVLAARCEALGWKAPVILAPPPGAGTPLDKTALVNWWKRKRRAVSAIAGAGGGGGVDPAPPLVVYPIVVHGTIADVPMPSIGVPPPVVQRAGLVGSSPSAVLATSPDAALFAAVSTDDLPKQRVFRAWLGTALSADSAERMLHDDEIVPSRDDAPAIAGDTRTSPDRWWVPRDPVVALTSVLRSYVHGYEGRFEIDGLLQVRSHSDLVVSSASIPDPKRLLGIIIDPPRGAPPYIDSLVYETVLFGRTSANAKAASSSAAPPISPVGYVEWSAPWIPLVVDSDARVVATKSNDWTLGAIDYAPPADLAGRLGAPGNQSTVRRRSMLTVGSLPHLADALRQLPSVSDATLELANAADITLLTLPGLREGLGNTGLVAGACSLNALRVVDAFSQILDIPTESLSGVAPEDSIDGAAGWCALPPRFYTAGAQDDDQGARLDFSWSEAGSGAMGSICGELMVNHLDQSLMAWEADATELGQIRTRIVEPGQGADEIVWEMPPGLDGEAGLKPSSRSPHMTNVLTAIFDATRSTPGDKENALSAVLRTIDATSWSKDPLGTGVSSHLAAIVGRPLVVVRAIVTVRVRHQATQIALQAAGATIQLRLGDLTRTDDGVLGYFANDDYSRFHAIDARVLAAALPCATGSGFAVSPPPTTATPLFGAFIAGSGFPLWPITHPFLVPPEITLVVGTPTPFTIIFDPRGRVYPDTGMFREAIGYALERADLDPLFAALRPAFRFGPIIGNVDEVRMPLPSEIEGRWDWVQRTDPTHWNDPIEVTDVSGSPRFDPRTARAREGYLRLTPRPNHVAMVEFLAHRR